MVLKVKNIRRDGKQSFVNLCICVRANKITALYPSTSLTLPPTVDIPIICQGITGRRPYSLKRTKNKLASKHTKTVYYEVSCGIVVGWVLKATVDRGSDPANNRNESANQNHFFYRQAYRQNRQAVQNLHTTNLR